MARANPMVHVGDTVTMFYYSDIRPALGWYRDMIGFEPKADLGWCVLLQIREGHYLGLVEGPNGSQTPIPGRNKGAILSIQTDTVDAWYAKLAGLGLAGTESGVLVGCEGRTREFKVYDPDGYSVEFFEWINCPFLLSKGPEVLDALLNSAPVPARLEN